MHRRSKITFNNLSGFPESAPGVPPTTGDREIARIRAVYRQRRAPEAFARYSPVLPGEAYMQQQREHYLREMLRRQGFPDARGKKILDVGCGRALRLMDWVRWGALPQDLYGIDLMPEMIEEAQRNLPGAHLSAGRADRLDFADRTFDIVVQDVVFSSILDDGLKQASAAEMLRVLKKDGFIVWYDLRYPSPGNPDVKPIAAPELARLFPQCSIDRRSVTLLPPLARRLAPVSPGLCRLLERLPPLRSHLLAIIRPS